MKHDETVQRQSYDQAYKNFWSFVDFNSMFNNEQIYQNEEAYLSKRNFNGKLSNNFFIDSKLKILDYSMNSVPNLNSKNNLTYKEARRRANELLGKSK